MSLKIWSPDSLLSFLLHEIFSYLCVCASLLSKPFPIGDRVTFSGKDCVCQQCSHTLVKPNEPIKIHGPSRKSRLLLPSVCSGFADSVLLPRTPARTLDRESVKQHENCV